MEFNWRSPIATRLLILIISVLGLGYFVFASYSFLPVIALLAILFFQLKKLIEMYQQPPENVKSYFESIRFDDFSLQFKNASEDPSTDQFKDMLNDAIQKLRISRREKDSEYQFLKNIVHHVGIGLIAFKKDGVIQVMNTAAKKLLHMEKAEKLDDLKQISQPLVDAILRLKTGGRELVRVVSGDETFQLSVYAIELTLRGEVVKLISMNNIQSELDEKEMEAWQNLVRVLTHEIMNSVTPISSLAGLIENELDSQLKEKSEVQLDKDSAEDMHLSIKTINKRSEGLIRFVKEFRNLSHVQQPKKTDIQITKLFEELSILHKKELNDNQITIKTEVEPGDLVISADKNMIEQVVINLIKNAIQSFDEQTDRKIWLSAYQSKGHEVISVRDNGPGIDPEAMEKIFIPFFTTKKSGSGIGLSLSKQIMRQHDGRISLQSKLGEGTEFLLRF